MGEVQDHGQILTDSERDFNRRNSFYNAGFVLLPRATT